MALIELKSHTRGCKPPSARQQRGIVLILALLIVALVTTVVVSVSWRFNLSVVRNMNRWHGAQARVHLEAAEQFALWGLREDAKNGKVDSLKEIWAQPVNSPSSHGMIFGQLEDAHGRLNLNLLVKDPPEDPKNPPPPFELLSLPQRMLIRLLQTFELEEGVMDEGQAMELVEAIEDWIDEDSSPTGSGGAESSYYESLDPPIYITNGEMASVSELALVKGMTPQLYKLLEPHVIALPGYKAGDGKKILPNINTLQPELLRTLNRKENLQPLDESSFSDLLNARNQANDQDPLQPGYREAKDFIEDPVVKAIFGEPMPFTEKDFVVSSNYFLLTTQVSIEDQSAGGGDEGRVTREGKAMLYRPGEQAQGQPPQVVRRTDAGF